MLLCSDLIILQRVWHIVMSRDIMVEYSIYTLSDLFQIREIIKTECKYEDNGKFDVTFIRQKYNF